MARLAAASSPGGGGGCASIRLRRLASDGGFEAQFAQLRSHGLAASRDVDMLLRSAVGHRTAVASLRRTPAGSTPSAAGGLSPEMLTQIARRLREAMAGWGTDEEAIYSALSGRTRAQAEAIAGTYRALYGRNLVSDLQDELTEGELKRLAIFNPAAAPPAGAPAATGNQAEQAAYQLRGAMAGAGNDESAIFATLTGRTSDELRAIREAYERMAGNALESDLRDELSGSELTEALRLLRQGALAPEDELYLAMIGAGTDEATVFRVLDSIARDPTAIGDMEQRYRKKYGDLVAHLRGDLGSGDYRRAMAVIRPVIQDAAFKDCDSAVVSEVRALIPNAISKVEKAIQVLSSGWAGMTEPQRAVFNRFFDPSASGDVDDEFVRDVLANLRAIRREFDDELTIECETDAGMCTGARLYYTYWGNIHVCPYFSTETNATRKARDLVHELAHNAMHALDRPYYKATSAEYQQLTPRGHWTASIPVIGAVARAISRSDTLYHPDAYSWFAFTVP